MMFLRSGTAFFLRPLAVLTFGVSLSFSQDTEKSKLLENPEYQAALRASSEGVKFSSECLFEIAAVKYERLLKNPDLAERDVSHVSTRWVDALLRSRQSQKALLALSLINVPDGGYWKAQALMMERRYSEAESELKSYVATNGRFQALAKLTLAQSLIAQGRESAGRNEFKELLTYPEPAIAERAQLFWNESEVMADRAAAVLKRLSTDRGDYEEEFVKACALLRIGEYRKGEKALLRLRDAKLDLSKNLYDAVQVRLVQADAAQRDFRGAGKRLVKFLDQDEDNHYYEHAFSLLEELGPNAETDPLQSLTEWAAQPEPKGRQALALFYLAKMQLEQGKRLEAIQSLEKFHENNPNHPRLGEVLRLLMSLYGSERMDDKVVALANEWRVLYGSGGEDTVDFLTAMIRFSRGEYADASQLFGRSASLATDVLQKQSAIFNMGLSALLGGNKTLFKQCVTQLESEAATKQNAADQTVPTTAANSAAQLLLENALLLASKNDTAAEAALQDFIKTYPNSPRVVDAYLAVAELCFLDLPPRGKAAQAALETASQLPNLTEADKENLAYTKVWLREAEENFTEVTTEGNAFLAQWPKSVRRDDVRMKIAQAYYRLQDYPNAETQFEAVAEENPESQYAEIALFFAGKSAMNLQSPAGLEKALTLWTEVVARNGSLVYEARREQATAKRREGKIEEALVVIENLVQTKPVPEGDDFLSLQIEKGELLALLARQDPKHLDAAVGIFYGIAQDEKVSQVWRSRAGVLLSQAYLQQGKKAEALEACYNVVEGFLTTHSKQVLTPQDYLWLYRAGFSALDMLEAREQWEAAANLADRLALAGGERSEVAKQRAERIRLEHFLWKK